MVILPGHLALDRQRVFLDALGMGQDRGAFVGQGTEDPIVEVEIVFDGQVAAMNTRALTSAAVDSSERAPALRIVSTTSGWLVRR